MSPSALNAKIVTSLREIDPCAWNSLNSTRNPFTSYELLATLETTDCVGGSTGWHPEFVTLWNGPQLVAAAPSYRKDHSFGEYVFDWAWADAYQRAGVAYYPKFLVAVPFSPVTGARLLTHPQWDQRATKHRLLASIVEHCERERYPTAHILFPDTLDRDMLSTSALLAREGFQFHWTNHGYADFSAYLSTLASRKRKNILRDRKQVRDAGITLQLSTGTELHESDWDLFYALYRLSAETKGGSAYLTRSFFHTLAKQLGDAVILVRARHNERVIAGALCIQGGNTLYGRNWGTSMHSAGLHFDACYYTPLEYCIEKKITHFDAGAQGEHKLARGFLPTPTYSYHWIAHNEFRSALTRYLGEETRHIEMYVDALEAAGPFKSA